MGLNYCIKNVTANSTAGSASNQQATVTNGIVDNVRVRQNPTSSEYLPIQYLGPAPELDKDGNMVTKPTYTLPEPSDCMKALDNAQTEPFDTEAEMVQRNNIRHIVNPQNIPNSDNSQNTVKHDIAMPIIVLIVLIIVIYLLKKKY